MGLLLLAAPLLLAAGASLPPEPLGHDGWVDEYDGEWIQDGDSDEPGRAAVEAPEAEVPVGPTPMPGPAPGQLSASCDLSTCTCAGVDMSALTSKVYQAPPDAEGYAYSIKMCGEIPKASLPSGCQQYAEHPSVVKVRPRHRACCLCISVVP